MARAVDRRVLAQTLAGELPSLFAKFPPRELLLPAGQEHWTAGLRSWMPRMPPVTVRDWSAFAPEHANAVLQAHFGTGRVDAFGFYEGESVLRAAGALLRYVQDTQLEFLPHVKRCLSAQRFLILDASTQRNLELTESLFDRCTEGSLLAILDRTVTVWVVGEILGATSPAVQCRDRRRQDAIAELLASLPSVGLRAQLRAILDLERLTSRLTSQIARPRDLVA
jgi:DNA mismatch repair protein MutS